MLVRFGYVAMSTTVENASPSKTMTATHFAKLADREAAVHKLERIAEENLHNTLRLLKHNRAHGIRVYRFSSKLIPLINHAYVEGWDPYPYLEQTFAEVGRYVTEHGMRVSFHPDHFVVLSTPREEVLRNSLIDLRQHVRMVKAMGLDERTKCNIHVGGAYGDKPKAAERFVSNFSKLEPEVRNRMTLENDDKTFTAAETLGICEQVGVPMVLDIHHHAVNHNGEDAIELWPRIHATWTVSAPLPPKIHMSSPKSDKDPRGHADYVDSDALLAFLRAVAGSTPQLDVMLEAKMKDGALFRLMEDLAGKADEGVAIVDGASVHISS